MAVLSFITAQPAKSRKPHTTEDNITLLNERGVKTIITTTPRHDGRSFGTNMMEAALTAYAGKGRRLSDEELNGLIDTLELKPSVTNF